MFPSPVTAASPAAPVSPITRTVALVVALLLCLPPTQAQSSQDIDAPASGPADVVDAAGAAGAGLAAGAANISRLGAASAAQRQPQKNPPRPAIPTSTPAMALRPSSRLAEQAPRNVATPVFISGDKMHARPDLDASIDGDAELRKPGLSVHADHLFYDQTTDVATVQGNVRANQQGNRYRALRGQMQVDAFEGLFLQPAYELLINGGHGQAERLELIDPDREVIVNGSYTTCRPDDPVIPSVGDIGSASDPDWKPDWVLRARRLSIDRATGMGRAEGGVIIFKGVPILAAPSLTFPVDSTRISGWLPPTFGLDNKSGLTLALPYYWNIAPNRDATLTTTTMTRRGVQLDGEFRYLENDYHGDVEATYMSNDKLRGRDRWALFARHDGSLDTGLPAIGRVGLDINFNRVSDDNYWQDFPEDGLFNLARVLPGDASLNWSRPGTFGDWNVSLRTLSWQTLQEPNSIITPPYSRMPELNVRWGRSAATLGTGDWDYSVETDYTRFQAPSALTGQPNADRAYIDASLSHPWRRPWGFFTPKVELNGVTYRFASPLSGGGGTASLTVPTVSLDSGLTFERQTSYWGRAFTQTLEPRLMYVYTPYRNQSNIPLYDTGPYDFNFATIWVDNAFVGHDRFSDNDTLTGGVTSRLIDPETGAEVMRMAVAQRYRFSPQRVTLPGETSTGRGWSDIMAGLGVNWTQAWGVDALQQYNFTTHSSTRTTLNLRYSPGPLRLVNFAYSREVDLGNKYIDIGVQWPLSERAREQLAHTGNPSGAKGGACRGGGWYGVGRLDYSIVDHQVVNGIFGVEYDAGCWVGRVVVEKLETTAATATKRILFQLELSGLARLGINPISSLRENISGYQPSGQPSPPPSRYSTYE